MISDELAVAKTRKKEFLEHTKHNKNILYRNMSLIVHLMCVKEKSTASKFILGCCHFCNNL